MHKPIHPATWEDLPLEERLERDPRYLKPMTVCGLAFVHIMSVTGVPLMHQLVHRFDNVELILSNASSPTGGDSVWRVSVWGTPSGGTGPMTTMYGTTPQAALYALRRFLLERAAKATRIASIIEYIEPFELELEDTDA